MALVIVSGLPSSGRTTRCEELISDLQTRLASSSSSNIKRIVHLTDASIHLPRSTYSDQRTEKPARASYLSLVSRNLTKDTIVIADGGAGLNIKGFRYQLWCAAREVGAVCLSVFISTSPTQCKKWNANRRAKGEDAYDDDTISDLFMRYEEPNAMTRWDSPLFVVANDPLSSSQSESESDSASSSASSSAQLQPCEPLPLDSLWETITSGKATKAPSVVSQNRTTSTNYLSLLESSTQSLIAAILAYGTLPPNGGTILVSPKPGFTLNFTLPEDKKPPTPPQLQRFRRQFVKFHATGFATGNLLGKEAKKEGGVENALMDDVHSNDAKDLAPEDKITKRFAVWLQEILQAQP